MKKQILVSFCLAPEHWSKYTAMLLKQFIKEKTSMSLRSNDSHCKESESMLGVFSNPAPDGFNISPMFKSSKNLPKK